MNSSAQDPKSCPACHSVLKLVQGYFGTCSNGWHLNLQAQNPKGSDNRKLSDSEIDHNFSQSKVPEDILVKLPKNSIREPLSENPSPSEGLKAFAPADSTGLEDILMSSRVSATAVDMNVLYPKLEALITQKETEARLASIKSAQLTILHRVKAKCINMESQDHIKKWALKRIESLKTQQEKK